jgi:hypothetical protein
MTLVDWREAESRSAGSVCDQFRTQHMQSILHLELRLSKSLAMPMK